MSRILGIWLVGWLLASCAGAPEPKAPVKTPAQIKADKIDGLRSAMERQFQHVEENKPLYLGELRGILEDLVALGENDLEVHLNLAQVLAFENRYEPALKILEQLLKESDAPELVQSYGAVLIALGRFEQAERLFVRDQANHPERWASLGQAATLAWRRGAQEKARELASQVLLEKPMDARALEVMIRDALLKGNDGIVGLLIETPTTLAPNKCNHKLSQEPLNPV